MVKLSPMERRVYETLEDGLGHKATELLLVIDKDGLADVQALYDCLSRLRRKLKYTDKEIVAQKLGWKIEYRMLRKLHYIPTSPL